MKTKIKKSSFTINPEMLPHVKKDGTRQVAIRLTQNRQHTREKMNIAIKPEFWAGEKDNWISKKHPNHKYLNLTLKNKVIGYENKYLELEKEKGDISTLEVYNDLNKDHLKTDFFAFWKTLRDKMTNYNNYKGYDNTKNYILDYWGTDKIAFKEITKEWLEGFDAHIRDCVDDCSHGFVYSKQKHIRMMFNSAIGAKVIDAGIYPFNSKRGGYKMPNPNIHKNTIERLDEVELKTLFQLEYERKDERYIAHLAFMLAFHLAGVRAEDLLTLKWENVKNGRVVYHMKKGITRGKRKDFEVTEKIQEILNKIKFGNPKKDEYILPYMSYQAESKPNKEYKLEVGSRTAIYNKILKRIGADLKTTKVMKSHLARHSWAAFTYEKTKDIKFIQQNLDHADIRTTMNYIGKLCTKDNDNRMKNVVDTLYDVEKKKVA